MAAKLTIADFPPGREFHDWTVIRVTGVGGKVLCACKCGKVFPVRARALIGETSRGCKSCRAKQRPKVKVECCDCGVSFGGTGKSIRCKKCTKKLEARLSAEWRKEHPEEAKRISNGYYHRTKHTPHAKRKVRERILQVYGLTIEHYEAMLESQGGVCAICEEAEPGKRRDGSPKPLAVDHDHDTGKVRGLLCGRCNAALGGLRDSPKLVRRLLRYLKTHKRP